MPVVARPGAQFLREHPDVSRDVLETVREGVSGYGSRVFEHRGIRALPSYVDSLRTEGDSSGTSGTVAATARHAAFVEFGVGPIFPKPGRGPNASLRFVVNGRVVFAKSSKGYPGKHVMARGAAEVAAKHGWSFRAR